MVTLTKALKWSPDGIQVQTIPAGEHDSLPERAIQIAEQIGILAVPEKPPKTGKNKGE